MKEKGENRRSFLKHLMAGTAMIAGVAGTKKNAQAKKSLGTESDKSEILYEESDTFKQYYKSLRY